MRYTIGDPTTRTPHPQAEALGAPFGSATEACITIVAEGLDASWWPLPVSDDTGEPK